MCCCWQDLQGSPGLPIIIVWWPTSIGALDPNIFASSAKLKDLHAKIQVYNYVCPFTHKTRTHRHDSAKTITSFAYEGCKGRHQNLYIHSEKQITVWACLNML